MVSQETAGGDSWYDGDTRVATSEAAVDNAVVWGYGPGAWFTGTEPNRAFVPVDFKYISTQ